MSLIVLNASAGSGKTYNLVLTYLKLILDVNKEQNAFSEVMAMTFTNKAALEMKSRIISYLHDISKLDDPDSEKNSKTENICFELAEMLNIDTATLIKRSKVALKSILHHFEDFNVVTIDKFNLRLIRSFSKELNISDDFKIVLNEEEILENVIENILDSLDNQEQNKLTNLVLNYSKEKLNEEQSWNFQNDLKLFSLILTNEKYFPQIDQLMKLDFSEEEYKALKNQIRILDDDLINQAKELYLQFSQLNFDHLPGKSRSMSAIEKLNSDSIFDYIQDDGGFFSSSMIENLQKENPKGDQFPLELVEKALQFNENYIKLSEDYLVFKTALNHFHNLALLKYISSELAKVKDREHIIRISEFNKLISQLIQDENAPFIYERLGTKYKHFLLDEFQDTSRLQWMNLVPLIYESLSNNFDNLIVGDAKQSIYRFKNGVAEQFVMLPKIYNPENNKDIGFKSVFFEKEGIKKVLENNFRSSKNIVQFNNFFYREISNYLSIEQKEFYCDVFQHPKGKDEGYIEIHSEKINSKSDINVISILIDWVDSIISDGYVPGDICILGNTKVECNSWAVALSEKYQVVSDDSLTVNSDDLVKLSIAYLKWYISQDSDLEAKRFIELYFSCFDENEDCNYSSLVTLVKEENRFNEFFDKSRFIIYYFGSFSYFFPGFENLYSLIQSFFRLVKIDEINNPYIHHFVDLLYQFDLNIGSDIIGFLKEYDTKLKLSSIQIPENKDSIKIMTGHKSKGLEFPVVILPNINFSLESKQTKLLVEQRNHFFYVPISKNSKIKNVKQSSNIELSNVFLDKLNLCYVMTTRPIDRLYIGNYFLDEKNFGQIFDDSLKAISTNVDFTVENYTYTFGNKKIHEENPQLMSDRQFIPSNLKDRLWFPKISLIKEMNDKEFELTFAQKYGNQLHFLLSIINSSEEVDEIIAKYSKEGILDEDFKYRLKEDLLSIFNNQVYKNVIEGANSVYSERKIITNKFETKVPDKIFYKDDEIVVVDFKTGLQNNKHKKQVSEYMQVLFQMESKPVKGFIFYTTNLELIQVTES